MDFPRLIDFTPTLDTNAYANNDTLFDAAVVTGALFDKDRAAILDCITLLDKDDQGVAIDLHFFSSAVTFGTINAAPSISDADILNHLGFVAIATGDYKDLGGARVAFKNNLGIIVKPASTTSNIYCAAQLGASTPTFTASGILIRLGFRRF